MGNGRYVYRGGHRRDTGKGIKNEKLQYLASAEEAKVQLFLINYHKSIIKIRKMPSFIKY